jgi:ribosome-binding factor A
MSRRRLERVTELIHQEISKRILFLKDPGLGFITILGVRLSPDFMQAKVFYSVLGSAEEQERTKAALERARHHLRSELGKLESLKFPPELIFTQDHSAEEAQKVLEVLNQLQKDRESTPQASPDLPSPSGDRPGQRALPRKPRGKKNA